MRVGGEGGRSGRNIDVLKSIIQFSDWNLKKKRRAVGIVSVVFAFFHI